jgi:hypothetical protein
LLANSGITARVAMPRCYRSGRWSRFGDGVVDLIPDKGVVWFVGEFKPVLA